ncbi:MAG: PIN domain-containing protein [Deltaproteobacteria bacterium]|nr:PIN domain-containing protein [Deltaproteobacteria bacterium]MBW2253868.1 PIN domain-containing protein [Deltaproteobacteria bacterium]
MSDRYFLDTNILVYSFDETDRRKREGARELIAAALEGAGTISFQVVQEFLNVALRKFARPMTIDEAQDYLDAVLVPLCRVHSEPDLYREALAARLRWRFSFYDSLIVAAALRSGCDILYSEDLQHGQQLGRVTVMDPFQAT